MPKEAQCDGGQLGDIRAVVTVKLKLEIRVPGSYMPSDSRPEVVRTIFPLSGIISDGRFSVQTLRARGPTIVPSHLTREL